MTILSESEVRSRARVEKSQRVNLNKSFDQILSEESKSFSIAKTYDIFLSHSVKDSEIILGIKGILEDLGYSVYIDWIDDHQLDRSKVNKSTADLLRERMNASKALLFVTTDNSIASKWMPWECGYFDALKQKVAIVPVKKSPASDEYKGQEYLGLYSYCLKHKSKGGSEILYVHKDKNHYIPYSVWIDKSNSEIEWLEQ